MDQIAELVRLFLQDHHAPQVLPLGLVVGVVGVFMVYPLFTRLTPFIMKYQRFHHLPVGDSPGVPGHYDYACISALCSLPDPQDFVGAYSYVPFEGGVKFRMRMPTCRYWSVTLYPGMNDPAQNVIPAALADSDFTAEADGSYEVVCSEERPDGCKNWLATQGIKVGLIVFRRYCVPNGVRIDYPELRRLDNNALIRPSSTTTTGSMAMEQILPTRYHHLLTTTLLLYLTLLSLGWSALAVNTTIAIALLVVVATTHLLYFLGRCHMQKRMADNQVKGKIHQVITPSSVHYGKNSAWPHPHHKYYVFAYDTTLGDVVIKGSILKGKQKFWSMVFYDMGGVPLPQFYNDTTITSTGEASNKVDYKVVVSSRPDSHTIPAKNIVNATAAPRGVCVLRVLYPCDESVYQESKPSIWVIPPRQHSLSDDKIGGLLDLGA